MLNNSSFFYFYLEPTVHFYKQRPIAVSELRGYSLYSPIAKYAYGLDEDIKYNVQRQGTN